MSPGPGRIGAMPAILPTSAEVTSGYAAGDQPLYCLRCVWSGDCHGVPSGGVDR
jgi:hypothetical protein